MAKRGFLYFLLFSRFFFVSVRFVCSNFPYARLLFGLSAPVGLFIRKSVRHTAPDAYVLRFFLPYVFVVVRLLPRAHLPPALTQLPPPTPNQADSIVVLVCAVSRWQVPRDPQLFRAPPRLRRRRRQARRRRRLPRHDLPQKAHGQRPVGTPRVPPLGAGGRAACREGGEL